ncbi:MAG: MBL fold metallo-hydrolase [Clostridia bacterium]|nr:MBL fold metallo-hydrolase [Clostridia bacterium]
MTYFCTLASGSAGNSAFYFDGRRRVLIDAGKNVRYLSSQLRWLGTGVEELDYVLITHSHSDHVSALPVLMKHSRAVLVCSCDTYAAVAAKLPPDPPRILFAPGETLNLGDCLVRTFATLHDAMGSCGYVVGAGRESVAFCTDTGTVTGEMFSAIRGSRAVVLEFNHDETLLKNGPYPYPLKLRILSDRGHLSNAFAGRVAAALCRDGTETLVLAHLSAENNRPALALEAATAALERAELRADIRLAPRDGMCDPVFF